jgi:orotate phosphoribosyltransferase
MVSDCRIVLLILVCYSFDFQFMSYRQELRDLLREKSLVVGDIVLSSGKKSSYYLDCKLTTLDPKGAFLTGHVLLELLQKNEIKADAIGGMSMGADPLVSAVSVISHIEKTPLPGFLIRKEAKKHGRMKQIEGLGKDAKDVVIVDEVCTTGKATQEAIDAAENEGYRVVAVISLVDREEGGSDAFRKKYKYFSVFTASELLANATAQTAAQK